MTKEELFEAALDLNGDDKKYIVSVEDNKIILRVKWKDATFFSPTSISDEMERFEYVVEVNDNRTYTAVENYASTAKSADTNGLKINTSTFVGTRKSCEIGLGIDNQTGNVGIIKHAFDPAEYKKPINELMKNSGYKKKLNTPSKIVLSILIPLLAVTIATVILVLSLDASKKPISTEQFEAYAISSGYMVENDKDYATKHNNIVAALNAIDEDDNYKISLI